MFYEALLPIQVPQEYVAVWQTVFLLVQLSLLLVNGMWTIHRFDVTADPQDSNQEWKWSDLAVFTVLWPSATFCLVELLRCFHVPMLFILIYCSLLAWCYVVREAFLITLNKLRLYQDVRHFIQLQWFKLQLSALMKAIEVRAHWCRFCFRITTKTRVVLSTANRFIATTLYYGVIDSFRSLVKYSNDTFDLVTCGFDDAVLWVTSRVVYPALRTIIIKTSLKNSWFDRVTTQIPLLFGHAKTQFYDPSSQCEYVSRPRFRSSYKVLRRAQKRRTILSRHKTRKMITLGLLFYVIASYVIPAKPQSVPERKQASPYPNYKQRRYADLARRRAKRLARLHWQVNREQILEEQRKANGTFKPEPPPSQPLDEFGFLKIDNPEDNLSYDDWVHSCDCSTRAEAGFQGCYDYELQEAGEKIYQELRNLLRNDDSVFHLTSSFRKNLVYPTSGTEDDLFTSAIPDYDSTDRSALSSWLHKFVDQPEIEGEPQEDPFDDIRSPLQGEIDDPTSKLADIQRRTDALFQLGSQSLMNPAFGNPDAVFAPKCLATPRAAFDPTYVCQLLSERGEEETKQVPVCVDTGCSFSMTNDIKDFVMPPQQGNFGSVNTVDNQITIQGLGVVRWLVKCCDGSTGTITTLAHYVPQADVKLLSPQHYSEFAKTNAYNDEKDPWTYKGNSHVMILNIENNNQVAVPTCHMQNLPILLVTPRTEETDPLTSCQPEESSVSVKEQLEEESALKPCCAHTASIDRKKIQVLDEANRNLNDATKRLLLDHQRLGHLGFHQVEYLYGQRFPCPRRNLPKVLQAEEGRRTRDMWLHRLAEVPQA